jgi:hypothetical protein
MSTSQKIAVIILLPAVVGYLGWLFAGALKSGHAYFPYVGYYARQMQPVRFWGTAGMTLALSAAFLVGWFMLVIEYMANWR